MRKRRGGKPELGPKKSTGKYDWGAMKSEYLSNPSMQLSHLMNKYRVTPHAFWPVVAGWSHEKMRLQQRAVEKVERKLVNVYSQYVENTKRLLVAINQQFAKSIQRTLRPNPTTGEMEIIVPLRTMELNQMSSALAVNIKTIRLLEGKSTENLAVKTKGDLNEKLVDLLEAMEEKPDEENASDNPPLGDG